MERIRTLTSTLVATLLYFTSVGIEAKVLSCEATKINGRVWIPTAFQIDVSNDRKTVNVISPVTDVFGVRIFRVERFKKYLFGSSFGSKAKGRSMKGGDYYDYQLRLDLDSNDTEAKIVMTTQDGYRDNDLQFRCSVKTSPLSKEKMDTASRLTELPEYENFRQVRLVRLGENPKEEIVLFGYSEKRSLFGLEGSGSGVVLGEYCDVSYSKSGFSDTGNFETICPSGFFVRGLFVLAKNGNRTSGLGRDNEGIEWQFEFLPRSSAPSELRKKWLLAVGRALDSESKTEAIARTEKALKLETSVNVCLRALDVSNGWKNLVWSNKDRLAVGEASRRGFDVDHCRRLTASFQDDPIRFHTGKELPVGMLSNESTTVQTRESNSVLTNIAKLDDETLCGFATSGHNTGIEWGHLTLHVQEAKRRELDCGVGSATQSVAQIDTIDSAEVQNLKDRLAQLEAEKAKQQQSISQDTQSPFIRITASNSDGARGTISGVATDNTGIAEVLIDGQAVAVDSSGRFSTSTFIPSGGIDVQITAYDLKGLSTTETVRLERTQRTQKVSRLAAVNPLLGPKQKPSRDRAALIIGVERYARAPTADFASRDAQMFADYAREKLGIPDNNIKVLTDSGALEAEILRALKVWLPKAVKPDTTDLYVFYAGHGMPTADGTSAYLVPYDGDIQLLEDTAISRKRFFDEISATKPRSATFFFDNCFSGATRSEELLLASRPLGIKVQETSIPDNYLVFAAGETDQIAGVEPEVRHGRFSYFVFKGLEGEADSNQDGKISAGELHKYVRESVGRFSAGAQTPTMLGDAGRWVLR